MKHDDGHHDEGCACELCLRALLESLPEFKAMTVNSLHDLRNDCENLKVLVAGAQPAARVRGELARELFKGAYQACAMRQGALPDEMLTRAMAKSAWSAAAAFLDESE